MTKIVNLRQYRKARQRQEKQASAEENRTRFGQSKNQRRERAQEEDSSARRHEGHRLGDTPGGDGDGAA